MCALTKGGVAMFGRFSLVLLFLLPIGLGVLLAPVFASDSPAEEAVSLNGIDFYYSGSKTFFA